MLAPYRPLFATARPRRLVAASLLGRLAVGGMLDLPLILLAQDASGSYAVGGAALGAHAAGVAISAPMRGRLVDRLGARTALSPFVVVTSIAIGALPLVADVGRGWLIVALAAVAGLSTPALVPSMRIEWQRLLGRGDARLAQAYAFETVAQVALFIVGPLIAGVGVAVIGTDVTLFATGGLALLGGMAFALQVGDPQGSALRPRALHPIRLPGLRTLVLTTVFADTGLGAVDVAVVAFAEQRGQAGTAGVLLALFAASSVLGGTVYGARAQTSAPARRLTLLTGSGAIALLPLALADSLLALGCLLVLAGAPFTAQWAARSLALDDVTPPDSAAEAYNWLSTANGAGIALGGLLAGAAIELSGTSAAFLASAGVVALAAAVIVAGRRSLSAARPR